MVPDDWRTLLRGTGGSSIFGSYEYASAWWRAFGASRRPRSVVVRDEFQRVRLVVPLFAYKGSDWTWRGMGGHRSDYTHILVASDDASAIATFARGVIGLPAWRYLRLNFLPAESGVMAGLAGVCGAASAQVLAYQRCQHSHPRIDVRGLATLRDLLTRQSHRKHVNWFRRHGSLEYERAVEPTRCRRLLDEFIGLHTRQWGSTSTPSLFLAPEVRAFYAALIDELSPLRAVVMNVLWFEGRMAAAHFGFYWQERFYYYKPAYDRAHAPHSPGKLLLAYIIRDAAADGALEVDLLEGREAYKEDYATDVRRTIKLVVRRSGIG